MSEQRLIDANALLDAIIENEEELDSLETVVDLINNAPIVYTKNDCIMKKCTICPHCDNCDVDENGEVHNERPQGVWTFDEKGYFYCDKCGKYPYNQYATTNFCPKCGADMRGNDNG